MPRSSDLRDAVIAPTDPETWTALDASSAAIQGELRLWRTKWGPNTRLELGNAAVGRLDDGGFLNAWPKQNNLELDGFSYERIGRLIGSDASDPPRQRAHYLDWLALDASYTPQPYQQLAGVLYASGEPTTATAVLYAARERERLETWRRKAPFSALGLSLLNWTIGYGLGGRYFRVLIWVGAFSLIGACFLWSSGADKVSSAASSGAPFSTVGTAPTTPAAAKVPSVPVPSSVPLVPTPTSGLSASDRKGFLWCLWTSFDWMLPFVDLDKTSTETVAKFEGGPFYWFYIQALAGYVLAGFLAAGLAGLTQTRGSH